MDGNPIPMPVLKMTTDTAGLIPKTPTKTEINNMTGNLVNAVDGANPVATPSMTTTTHNLIKSVSMRHSTLPSQSPSQLTPSINPRITLNITPRQEEAFLRFPQARTHPAARQVQGQETHPPNPSVGKPITLGR